LHQAKGAFDVQIVHFRACLSENQEKLILAFEGIGNDEIFNAGLFGSSFEGQHIRLLFLTPYCLFVHALLDLFPPVELPIAIVQVFERHLSLGQIDVHASRSRKTEEVGFIANGGVAELLLIANQRKAIAQEGGLESGDAKVASFTVPQIEDILPNSLLSHSQNVLLSVLQ
jgi:hypothetical protein